MELALAEAQLAWEAGEVPIGAVVVAAAGVLIGRGHNQPIATQDPTAHAEIMALRQAAARVGNYRLPGSTLYVTIEPCIMCVGAMLQARVQRLVFGATDPKGGAVVSLYRLADDPRLNHRIEVVAGVAAEAARTMLQEFFRERRARGTNCLMERSF
jgi:tRNA(adenine34) deaminase